VTRVAAVDIGTNSTRLLVADVEGEKVRELDRRLQITRLGEGVDERRILLPQASARSRLRRAQSATPRTARRSSAKSSGATPSRRCSSAATRRRSSPFAESPPDATLRRERL